jgi:hypothetical protein
MPRVLVSENLRSSLDEKIVKKKKDRPISVKN